MAASLLQLQLLMAALAMALIVIALLHFRPDLSGLRNLIPTFPFS